MEKGMAALLQRKWSLLGFAIVFLVQGSIGAKAERPIGVVTALHPVVEQVGAPGLEVKAGDPVLMNEAIKTGFMGEATISFADESRLAIDPVSRTVLSSFIFAGDKRFSSATFHLSQGAFHFWPGRSDAHAYIFKTPSAVLTVRDASFDVSVADRKTTVHVLTGSVELCRRGAGSEALLRKDYLDETRDRNLIVFSKSPPVAPPKEDFCHRSSQCLLIGPNDTGVMSDDPGTTGGCFASIATIPPPPIVTCIPNTPGCGGDPSPH
jgi:hypothetical protein